MDYKEELIKLLVEYETKLEAYVILKKVEIKKRKIKGDREGMMYEMGKAYGATVYAQQIGIISNEKENSYIISILNASGFERINYNG